MLKMIWRKMICHLGRSHRSLALVLILPALVAGFAGAARAQAVLVPNDAPPPPVSAGTHAWNFTTHTLDGQKLTLSSLRGHVTIVDFWATWCGPCRMSIPGLEAIYRQYRKRGVRVVGMSLDTDTVKDVRPFVRSAHMTYTIGVDPQRNPTAARHYNAGSIPAVFIVDRKGVIRWSFSGFYFGIDDNIKAQLNKLLSEKA